MIAVWLVLVRLVTKGRNLGPHGNSVVCVVGAVLGGFLLGLLVFLVVGLIEGLTTATVSAMVILYVLRKTVHDGG